MAPGVGMLVTFAPPRPEGDGLNAEYHRTQDMEMSRKAEDPQSCMSYARTAAIRLLEVGYPSAAVQSRIL